MQTELLRTVEKSQHFFDGLLGHPYRHKANIMHQPFVTVAPSPEEGGRWNRALDFSLYPHCRGNTRSLSHIGKHGSHI